MPIFAGSDQIFGGSLFIGGTQVAEVYYGSVKIFPLSPPPPAAPTVSQHPASQSKVVTETVTFTAGFNYDGPLTYQWEDSPDGVVWTPMPGETGTSLSFTCTLELDQTQYRCVATDDYNRVATTNAATLTVANPPSGSQTFTSNGTFTVPAGVTSITVSGVGGGGGGGGGRATTFEGSSGAFRIFAQGGGAGGAGAQVLNQPMSVTPGQQIAITIGNGGAGGAGGVNSQNGSSGSNGGNTVVAGLFTANGGLAGSGGTQFSSNNSNGYAWAPRTPGGGTRPQSGSYNKGGNGGGGSGNGAGTNSSQRTNGEDDVKVFTNPSGRAGGSWQDTAGVQTATGGGNGGSTNWGVGGLGGRGRYGGTAPSGTTGAAGTGGGGGGGCATLSYLTCTSGKGGNGAKGRVDISWG